jgi:hypothetical protein
VARQLRRRKALADDPRENLGEPYSIVHVFAIVEAEGLLCDIRLKVEGFGRDIGSVDPASTASRSSLYRSRGCGRGRILWRGCDLMN